VQYPLYDPSSGEVPPVQTYRIETPIPATRGQAIKKGIWQELKDAAFGELKPGYRVPVDWKASPARLEFTSTVCAIRKDAPLLVR
jgi:hypothetical protein